MEYGLTPMAMGAYEAPEGLVSASGERAGWWPSGDVRMLAAQRQAMGATVEQFVNDLDLMATGKPCRIEDRGW